MVYTSAVYHKIGIGHEGTLDSQGMLQDLLDLSKSALINGVTEDLQVGSRRGHDLLERSRLGCPLGILDLAHALADRLDLASEILERGG